MQVVELRAHHVRVPLKRTIRHASHARQTTDNVVIVCVLKEGIVGIGEGVPREYVTGESIASVMEVLKQTDWRPWLEDRLDRFDQAAARCEAMRLKDVPDDPRQCKTNAARCAAELALLDAAGQQFGQPLGAVVRLLEPELHEPRGQVQYSGAITSSKGKKAKLAALAMWLYRFRHLKIKVGIAGQDDAARVRSIRRWAGRSMDLRIDANEAWPVEEVVERLRALEPMRISAVEQPVRHEDIQRMAEVRQQTTIPIMLDESLCSMVDAERTAAEGYGDLFNLRLSKCGGLIPSLRLAAFARRHGLGYQLGCQVGESAILSAAGRHLAANVRDVRYCEGSYDDWLIKENPAGPNVTFGWGGWAPALTAPGLGVQLKQDVLDRLTLAREVLYVRR